MPTKEDGVKKPEWFWLNIRGIEMQRSHPLSEQNRNFNGGTCNCPQGTSWTETSPTRLGKRAMGLSGKGVGRVGEENRKKVSIDIKTRKIIVVLKSHLPAKQRPKEGDETYLAPRQAGILYFSLDQDKSRVIKKKKKMSLCLCPLPRNKPKGGKLD